VANVVWMLMAFRRDDEELAGQWPIRELELSDFQAMFGESGEMYDSYPVAPELAAALGSATGQRLDLDRFDYFVEAHAASVE
jgi:hypothetical protein